MAAKKGIELQVNFLVMFIMAIVVFSIGIYVVYSVFQKADESQTRISDQMKRQMEQLMYSGGNKVVIPSNSAELEIGKSHAFWVGIRNTLGSVQFRVEVNCKIATKLDQETIICDPKNAVPCSKICDSEGHWFMEKGTEYTINQNEHIIQSIVIQVPKQDLLGQNTQRGLYIFNVQVKYLEPSDGSWHDYDTIKKLYVTVK